MPLIKGNSNDDIQENIKEMIASNHDPKQAEAAAYHEAGRDSPRTYLDVLKEANSKENDAIALGLELIALAPPEDISSLLEITNDENDHSRIYAAILARFESEGSE